MGRHPTTWALRIGPGGYVAMVRPPGRDPINIGEFPTDDSARTAALVWLNAWRAGTFPVATNLI